MKSKLAKTHRKPLRDKIAALLFKLDQQHPTNALWNAAGVDYYAAADAIIRVMRRHVKNWKTF